MYVTAFEILQILSATFFYYSIFIKTYLKMYLGLYIKGYSMLNFCQNSIQLPNFNNDLTFKYNQNLLIQRTDITY